MLWLGGVETNIYELGKNKILVGLQKGIFVKDLCKFLEQQSIVMEYEWNGQTFSTKRKANTRKQKAKKKWSQGSVSMRPRTPRHSQTEL